MKKIPDLYTRLQEGKVKCHVCQRGCIINDQQVGFCLSRKNVEGQLKSLLEGRITGIQVDPIEKKPLYHYKPGSFVATIGSYGCNFRCRQCLNYPTTWGASPTIKQFSNSAISPLEIAQEIVKAGYTGLAFSYNEPTIWADFASEIAREFKVAGGQFTVFVTNGSWTQNTIDLLTQPIAEDDNRQLIDAANIDIKGFSEETYTKQGAYLGIIPEMAVYAQKKGIFLELTTLLIPTINDDPEEIKHLTEWIVKDLGPDTPWHLSQFDPQLAPTEEFRQLPFTSRESLERTAQIGKEAGLAHIYIWSSHGDCNQSDTFCPNCHNVVIKRNGWQVEAIKINPKNHCQFCHYRLNVVL